MSASANFDDNDWKGNSSSEEEKEDDDEEGNKNADENDDEEEGDDEEDDEDEEEDDENDDDDDDGTDYRSPILRTQSPDAEINTGKRSDRTPLPSDPTNLENPSSCRPPPLQTPEECHRVDLSIVSAQIDLTTPEWSCTSPTRK
jgi:hypothetical protein